MVVLGPYLSRTASRKFSIFSLLRESRLHTTELDRICTSSTVSSLLVTVTRSGFPTPRSVWNLVSMTSKTCLLKICATCTTTLSWRLVRRPLTIPQIWAMCGRLMGALRPHLQMESTTMPSQDNWYGVPIQPRRTVTASWKPKLANMTGECWSQLLTAGTRPYPF